MAKNKKLTPELRRKRSARRLKKRIIQLVLLAVVGGSVYLLVNPQIVADPVRRGQIEQVREKVMGASVGTESVNVISQDSDNGAQAVISQAISKSKSYIDQAFRTIKIPKKISGTSEEIVVEDVVSNLSNELKQLPAEQVKKIKIELCQDVIEEAVLACEQ